MRLAGVAALWGAAAAHEAFDGDYVLVNRASGRRISSGPTGFAATAGGPDRAILPEHRWRLLPQTNDTYVIENSANGMRIFAQSGKNGGFGFLTTDEGPVYQDQTWRPLPQSDGSHALVNARSDRVIMASAGEDGAAGFAAVQAESSHFAEDQAWWLVDPDKGHHAAVQKLQAEIRQLHATLAEEREAAAAAGEGLMALSGSSCNHTAGCSRLTSILLVAACVIGIWFCLRRSSPKGGEVKSPEVEKLGVLAHGVFCSEVDGVAMRTVRIQCPGVEHSGIEVDLLCDGCEVTISREASLGVEAVSWKKQFRFEPAAGPFEFREDRMLLEHGFLQLIFQERSFQARTVRFPQHYSLAASDGDLLWEESSTSAGSESLEPEPPQSPGDVEMLRFRK
eukprot:TRINITY_DN26948_c0_g1_i1.p1 TRINITY_DN26948_c0_g1~~TRINITY_DN26948_c0_g1_i1.p1  ORF type:complete len:394 (-),score=109.30 TRINITY_DN26948_c0_g1_i1:4-1185(-)